MTKKQIFWLLLAVCVLTLIPFLGLAEFNTKGEPREAVVSMSMLDTGNWVLPRNNGGEMPYKPMFFHWCVAAVSSLVGGVNEFTSRFPSAIALMALVLSTFVFFARRKGKDIGLVTALIVLLCMELHRAGANCRVDMVLTTLTVGAIFMFYRWYERGMKGVPLIATLLMSLGTMTKGPVGFIIPCIVIGGFLLLKSCLDKTELKWKTFFLACLKIFASAVLSFVLPALWYYAAYQQGGQEFWDLMYEENIGRMTHSMGYESCVEPWWFTVLTLTYGFVPFTLLLVFGLFSLKGEGGRLKVKGNSLNKWLAARTDTTLFSIVGAVIIVVFYSIPQSKRSVYVMPAYPFIAYFIAQFMWWLAENGKKSIKVYNCVLAGAGILAFVAFVLFKMRLIPETWFSGSHAAENIATINAIGDMSSWWELLLILIPTFVCGYYFVSLRGSSEIKGERAKFEVYFSLVMALAINLAVDGAYKNPALNVKSVKYIAEDLKELQLKTSGQSGAPLTYYEYIEIGEQALGDPVHYFELNFYLHNTIENFLKSRPKEGLLLIGEDDFVLRFPDFEKEGYEFFGPLYVSDKEVVGQIMNVYRFQR
ncbi:MAG: glycosyltransferase family 39 protein [Bacteroidales bacterium]|nr:glycosyltransferase family 39 protein [Bacteroidales bacterium]